MAGGTLDEINTRLQVFSLQIHMKDIHSVWKDAKCLIQWNHHQTCNVITDAVFH